MKDFASWKLGFMDCLHVCITALIKFQDLSKLQNYMEAIDEILMQDRVDCILNVLKLESFEEFEKILNANKLAEEIETKV